jgi:hypothetical protein
MAVITSNGSGFHDVGGTWVGGVAPSSTDSIVVANGHIVICRDARTFAGGTINAGGKWLGTVGCNVVCNGNFSNSNSATVAGFELEIGAKFNFGNTGYTFTEPSKYPGNIPGIKIRGTLAAPCEFGTLSGGTNARITGSVNYFGLIDSEYCIFTRLGSGAANAIEMNMSSDGSDSLAALFRLHNCIFDACGDVFCASTAGAYAKFDIKDVTFKNSVGSYNIRTDFYNAKAGVTSIRTLDHVVFDKQPNFLAPRDMTFINCHFDAGFVTTNTDFGGWALWENNFVRGTGSANSFNIFGNVKDFYYLFDDAAATNKHFFNVGTYAGQSTYVVDGGIFEATGSDATGDCLVVATPGSAVTITMQNNIFLPNASGENSGTPFSALGNANTTLAFNKNTYIMGTQGCAIGETYAGHAGMLSSFKNNLAYDTSARGYKLYDSGADDAVNDIVTAANCTNNGGFNFLTGSNLKGYNALNFSSGSPGANDVTGDPLFVDKDRDIAKWDLSLGGPGTAANALAEMRKCNDFSGFNTAYTLANLLEYVRVGFAPTASIYKGTGAGGVDIGAVDVVSSSHGSLTLLGVG